MFADSFLANLLLFVAGQAAAWFYLRTGRFLVGAAATASLWLLADWFVMARFVFGASPADQRLPLLLLQALSFGLVGWLAWQLWRRRWSAVAKQRPELFRVGLEQYLRGDHGAAKITLRRLVRNDPWDASAWLALGNVLARMTQPRAAMTCYRRAAAVDTKHLQADLLAHQRHLLEKPRPAPAASVGPVASGTPHGAIESRVAP